MQFDMSLEGAGSIGASDDGLPDQKAYGFDGELMKRGRASESLDVYSNDLPATGFSSIKMLKTDELPRSKPMPSQTRDTPSTSISFPQGFLGVSSLPELDGLLNISVQTTAFPSFQSLHTRVAGLSSSSLNRNIQGVPVGFEGPFAAAQLLELEHQVLIFNYMAAGAPVPPNLLLTIRKNLGPSPPSANSSASLAPNHVSWGSAHLPFSGNGDPEPGRCRRTDGKKWRCAREAVTDQRYCERHLSRGRHRSSRKTVEGQTGNTCSGKGAASARMALPSASSPSPSPASDSLSMKQPQVKSSNTSADPTSAAANFCSAGKFSITNSNPSDPMPNLNSSSVPCSANLESGSLSAAKQQFLCQHSSRMKTGFNLLYNAQSNSYLQSRNFGLRQHLKTRAPEHAQCFCPSTHGRPKINDVQAEATCLATSMPAATLGSSSSSLSSPMPEQLALSPLKFEREVHPIQMGLSVGDGDCSSPKQTNWVPRSWEMPFGGPLAEALNSTNVTTKSSMEAKNSSALNLIARGWDANSPLQSSPTGVLQKTAFGTLSCSSAGSSPRPETCKVNEDCPPDDPLVPSL
ncbi:Growth-regulating factor 6 [Nymphaea thermarum]|nr:Growth-regulating factor 6 [Nymphaea thermarum]